MQLVSITFINAPEIQGIRSAGFLRIHCLKNGPMAGWRAAIRGASVLLISPPLVRPATQQSTVHVVEVPRSQCQIEWACSPTAAVEAELDEILKAKFITPPFGEPKAAPAPAPAAIEEGAPL